MTELAIQDAGRPLRDTARVGEPERGTDTRGATRRALPRCRVRRRAFSQYFDGTDELILALRNSFGNRLAEKERRRLDGRRELHQYDRGVLAQGERAPDFALLDQDGNVVRLSDLRGHRVLLWWYPKASTPG